MDKLKKQLKKIYKENKSIILICAIIFILMLVLNILSPMVCDDYAYTTSFATGERINSIGDIIKSQIAHYNKMNGRIVTHSLVQLFLWLPRIFIIIFNSLAFVLLGYVIYKHANNTKNIKPIALICIYIMIWFLSPSFYETILWKDGAINYLWGTLIILLTLLPFSIKNNKKEKRDKLLYLMPIAGFLSGFCSENTSGAMILFVILVLTYKYFKYKKVNLWEILTLISMMIGFIIMVKAPGNLLRKATMENANIFTRIYDITKIMISGRFGISILIYVYLFTNYVYKNKTIKGIEKSIIMFICFVAGCYALALSPFSPGRSFFGPYMLYIVSIVDLFLKSKINIKKQTMIPCMSCLLVALAFSYLLTVMDNGRAYIKFIQRENHISEELKKDNKNLVVEPIKCNNINRCPWIDITYDEKSWQNVIVANYYGLDTIVLK